MVRGQAWAVSSRYDAELGGMLVFKKFRHKGVAGKIVELLLKHSNAYKRLFCLPFSHLSGFYEKYGFHTFDAGLSDVPKEVINQYAWCNQTYEYDTLLLMLENDQRGLY